MNDSFQERIIRIMGDSKAIICLACEADALLHMYSEEIERLENEVAELEEENTSMSEAQPPI